MPSVATSRRPPGSGARSTSSETSLPRYPSVCAHGSPSSCAPIFDAPELAEARKRLHEFAQGLGRQVPEALACLEAGFTAATQFYAFPREHWTRIRSTNGLERLHGEVKRRTRSIGAFPDRDSALRLVTAVALETAHVWADRRYLDMSLLNTEAPKVVAA